MLMFLLYTKMASLDLAGMFYLSLLLTITDKKEEVWRGIPVIHPRISPTWTSLLAGGSSQGTKACWAHFRWEKNYIFRELTRNFREITRYFREFTRNFRE